MDTYVRGGLEQIMPVHAAVSTLGDSSVPQETSAGGTGASRVAPSQVTFDISIPRNNPICVSV